MFAIFPPTPDFCHAQGFPSGGSCRQSRLMRGSVVRFEMFSVCTAPKPPLCKGRWHGAAVTKGLCGGALQVGMHRCEPVQSIIIAVGAGFYPARRSEIANMQILGGMVRMRRNACEICRFSLRGRGKAPPLRQICRILRARR